VTEPTPLDREQLQPIIDAFHKRETCAAAGVGFLLPPFAPCPTCGQSPIEMAISNTHPDHFLTDRVAFRFRPCDHTFTADGEDIYLAHEAARGETP